MAKRGRKPKNYRPLNSRNKGAAGEREVAKILRERGYTGARRGVQYHGGPDSPDVRGLPGFHLEVKRVEKGSIYKFMEQAREDAGWENVPLVVHRRSNEPWMVIIDLDEFLNIMDRLKLKENDE